MLAVWQHGVKIRRGLWFFLRLCEEVFGLPGFSDNQQAGRAAQPCC
jgi:hypothetical protein